MGVTGGFGVGVPSGTFVGVAVGCGVSVGVELGSGEGVGVGVPVGAGVGSSVGVAAGRLCGAGLAHAAPTNSSATIRLSRRVRTPLCLQMQKPRHPRVEHLAVLWLSRQKPFVVDESRLLLDPLAPAVGAGVGEDRGAPSAGQRRPVEALLALRAAPADHLSHNRRLVR